MKVYQIARQILADMGGDAQAICTGDCPEFAKRLVDACGRGQIVDNLSGAAMKAELEGYDVIQPEEDFSTDGSHCWVKIDHLFYDAFNPEGCQYETDMLWVENM